MNSGYEMRYSIVRDAKDMMYEQWRLDCESVFKMHDLLVERWRSRGSVDEDLPHVKLPDPPSIDQIITKAGEIYDFVKKKD